jgi:hypothetical protein
MHFTACRTEEVAAATSSLIGSAKSFMVHQKDFPHDWWLLKDRALRRWLHLGKTGPQLKEMLRQVAKKYRV